MKIVMTLLCRDEEDIIEENILFHLSQGIDHLIITDNGSNDATVPIIQKFCKTGKVRLIHEESQTHDQALWVSRMAAIASNDYHADWLIHADADEFWMPRSGSCRDILGSLGTEVRAISVSRYNFPPLDSPHSEADQPFYKRQTIREVISRNSLGQRLPPKICHRVAGEMWIDDGNHSVYLDRHLAPAADCSEIEILHYPARSLNQYTRKIRNGAEALERNERINRNIGGTWRAHYAQLNSKGTLIEEYSAMKLQEPEIAKGLSEGWLVEDYRLNDFLSVAKGLSQ